MIKPAIRILVGFLCKILLSKRNVVTCTHNCDAIALDSLTGFDCSSKGLLKVPQDLDLPVEILLLQNNNLDHLDENSFAKYAELVILNLSSTSYVNQDDPIDYHTFRPLKKLEILVMENLKTAFRFHLDWPPSLKVLAISENAFIETIDLSTLTQLRVLFARACRFHSFPKFNATTPLTVVDLRLNPLENLTVDDLAPFCLLRAFLLEWPVPENPLSSPDKFCQCIRLEKWFNLFQIDSGSSYTPFVCIPPIFRSFYCDIEFSDQILRAHKECLQRNMTPLFSSWFLVAVGIIVFIPFVILAFWYSERQRKRREREMSENDHEDGDRGE